jgi:hypothetical protein
MEIEEWRPIDVQGLDRHPMIQFVPGNSFHDSHARSEIGDRGVQAHA